MPKFPLHTMQIFGNKLLGGSLLLIILQWAQKQFIIFRKTMKSTPKQFHVLEIMNAN